MRNRKSRQKVPLKRKMMSTGHLIMSFRKKMAADKLDVYAAQASFYLMMSVIPMLMLMFTMLQFTPLSEEMILDALSEVLYPEAMDSVRTMVSRVYRGSVTLISFSAVSLFWVAGRGVTGLANGLNSIYHLRENRNYILQRIRSSLYTILLVAAFIMSAGLLVLGVRVRAYINRLLPQLKIDSGFSQIILILVLLGALTVIFDALYVFLPNRKRKFGSQIYGAVFTTLSWAVWSYGFSIYLKAARNLSVIYGGLLTVVVAMMWLYYCIYLFFFGAEINAWRENPDILPY